MPLKTMNLTPRIGTEIEADAGTLLGGGGVGREIRALLEQRGVIVVRGVNFDDGQQLTFANTLGTIRTGNLRKQDKDGQVTLQTETQDGTFKVTFDKTHNPVHSKYLAGTFNWHMDGTWDDVPPLASILTPRVLSVTGGQTEFANTYAAYDDVPESEKKFMDGLKVMHLQAASYRNVIPNPTPEQLKDWDSYPKRTHPLVWRHRSERKSLALSSSAYQIAGMNQAESDALLKRIWDWVTQPKYVYQHHWKMGDMLMWDNTGTMHRVLQFDVDSGRRLHRVTLGRRPVAAHEILPPPLPTRGS